MCFVCGGVDCGESRLGPDFFSLSVPAASAIRLKVGECFGKRKKVIVVAVMKNESSQNVLSPSNPAPLGHAHESPRSPRHPGSRGLLVHSGVNGHGQGNHHGLRRCKERSPARASGCRLRLHICCTPRPAASASTFTPPTLRQPVLQPSSPLHPDGGDGRARPGYPVRHATGARIAL